MKLPNRTDIRNIYMIIFFKEDRSIHYYYLINDLINKVFRVCYLKILRKKYTKTLKNDIK